MGALRALFAAMGMLVPTHPASRAPDHAPFVEVIEASASVQHRSASRVRTVRESAEDEALRQAVRRVAALYSPQDVGISRFDEAVQAVSSRPRDFIHRYRVLEASVGASSTTVTVEAMVLGGKVREALFARGLRKPGERLEMAVLTSTIRGGDSSRDDAGGGHSVLKRPFSVNLLGLMVRYYLADDAFAEVSWQTLANPVEIGSYFNAAGARSSLVLQQYSPISASLGVDMWRWRGVRLNASAGVGAVSVRANLSPIVIGRVREHGFDWSPLMTVGAQWAPTAHLGVGVRGEYRPVGPLQAFVSVPMPQVHGKAEVLFAF